MEDNYYFCGMSVLNNITYFNHNIAELNTPKLSLGTDISIGSSGSQSSISDFIESKPKCVGLFFNRSMSNTFRSKLQLTSVCNVKNHNKRPASYLGLAKLYSVETEYIPNYW